MNKGAIAGLILFVVCGLGMAARIITTPITPQNKPEVIVVESTTSTTFPPSKDCGDKGDKQCCYEVEFVEGWQYDHYVWTDQYGRVRAYSKGEENTLWNELECIGGL